MTISAAEFVEATGITYRQLDYWTRRGFLTAHSERPGQGYPRTYGADQVPVARLMGQLVGLGFARLDVAHDIAVRLHCTGRADLDLGLSARLVISRKKAPAA